MILTWQNNSWCTVENCLSLRWYFIIQLFMGRNCLRGPLYWSNVTSFAKSKAFRIQTSSERKQKLAQFTCFLILQLFSGRQLYIFIYSFFHLSRGIMPLWCHLFMASKTFAAAFWHGWAAPLGSAGAPCNLAEQLPLCACVYVCGCVSLIRQTGLEGKKR